MVLNDALNRMSAKFPFWLKYSQVSEDTITKAAAFRIAHYFN